MSPLQPNPTLPLPLIHSKPHLSPLAPLHLPQPSTSTLLHHRPAASRRDSAPAYSAAEKRTAAPQVWDVYSRPWVCGGGIREGVCAGGVCGL